MGSFLQPTSKNRQQPQTNIMRIRQPIDTCTKSYSYSINLHSQKKVSFNNNKKKNKKNPQNVIIRRRMVIMFMTVENAKYESFIILSYANGFTKKEKKNLKKKKNQAKHCLSK